MRKVCVAILWLLSFASCEKDFVVKDQDKLKGMVINCFFNDLQPLTVYLTGSYTSSGSNTITGISDAKVELYEDGVLKEQLAYVPSDTLNRFGAYHSQLIPQAGKKYMVKASHPAYGTVTAEDEIPEPAQLVSQTLISYPDTFGETARVKFRIKDDASAQNYYRINAWVYYTQRVVDDNGDTVELSSATGLRATPLSPLLDTLRDTGWYPVFSDRNFNGLEKEIELSIESTPTATKTETMTLYVELYTISKQSFEYYRTVDLYHQTSYNTEPVHVYSNVQNGYGIFAGYAFSRMQFVVK